MPRTFDNLWFAIQAGALTLDQAQRLVAPGVNPENPIAVRDAFMVHSTCVTIYEDCITFFLDFGPGHCYPVAAKEYDDFEPRIWSE